MKHCTRFESLLALHAGNDLSTDESAAVERHLADCPGCRQHLAALVESQSFFQEIRGEHVPDDLVRGVRRRVLDQIDEDPRRVLGWPIRIERALVAGVRRPLAVATTFGLALFVAIVWISMPGPSAVEEPVVSVEAPEVEDFPERVLTAPNPEEAIETAETVAAQVDGVETPVRVPAAIPVAIDWNPPPVEIQIPPQRTVKLVTDDPKVIIYWVLEEGNQGGGA